ncbi:MAG: hypothetical protein FJ096_21630 [Deltaproteobacteria bacterium]|nr:hypothetical protein [Deltaproteobacteria bacterium]
MSDASDDTTRSTPLPSASVEPVPPPLVLPGGAVTGGIVDDALPFQRPKTNPTPEAAPASTLAAVPKFAPELGLAFPRRPAPRELASPGALIPLGTFLASLGPPPHVGALAASSTAPAVRPSTFPPSPVASIEPIGPSPGVLGELTAGDSPWLARSAGTVTQPGGRPAGEADAPSSEGPPRSATAGESLGTSSPWLANPSVPPPGLLPSTQASYLGPVEPPSAARPHAPPPLPSAAPLAAQAGGARPGMTVGLVLVAFGLLGAIVFVAVGGNKKTEDPADVKAGQSQREYVMQALSASASASAPAAPPPPPRVQVRPVAPPPSAVPPKPKADIYEDL